MGYAISGNYHRPMPPKAGGGSSSGQLTTPVSLPFIASGQRMIAWEYIDDDWELVYADASNLAHAQSVIGFTLTAGSDVQLLVSGIYVDGTMSWDPTLPLWLGAYGTLTQTVPTSGLLMQVGRVLAPNKIQIDIEPTIVLF